ncbi:hypothetical protein FHS76_002818 [Ochrobactrum daejeonense]|uniref:Uncharacterized protein n=1 Tax=Brucella daejeonensis TaxID=659015 RepID=A0A7W9EM11_9HYPH|nr:hypothetical protein [Brucella daejeonensis]MBB5702927.1 hypothetical protein [Brucella daejeonensis]
MTISLMASLHPAYRLLIGTLGHFCGRVGGDNVPMPARNLNGVFEHDG